MPKYCQIFIDFLSKLKKAWYNKRVLKGRKANLFVANEIFAKLF